jgi:hypothetical protein
MDVLFWVFAIAAAVAAVLAAIAIWAPRRTVVRVSALVVLTLFLPVIYLQSIELLSKPKPMDFEWYHRDADGAQVLGVSLDEGRAIYLWLRLDGSKEPRAYSLPWNLAVAQRLEDAVDEAVRRGGIIILRKPFYRKSLEDLGELNVDIHPPPLGPQKKPPMPPQIFNPREEKI